MHEFPILSHAGHQITGGTKYLLILNMELGLCHFSSA
jgi:hypothetical protein